MYIFFQKQFARIKGEKIYINTVPAFHRGPRVDRTWEDGFISNSLRHVSKHTNLLICTVRHNPLGMIFS